MKMLKGGVTLTELLVGVVVAAIVVLMVGAIGTIAVKSYNDLRKKSDVYNDAQFALQLIREAVRQSTSAPAIPAANCLQVAVGAANTFFYIQGIDLVYGSVSCASAVNKPIITGVTGLVFTPDVGNLPLVIVTLSGTKAGASFDYSLNGAIDNRMKALRRNL